MVDLMVDLMVGQGGFKGVLREYSWWIQRWIQGGFKGVFKVDSKGGLRWIQMVVYSKVD